MDDREQQVATETMNESLLPYMGSAKDVVSRYTHCVVCGANLHFMHQTDFSRNVTQETAKCPECGIRVRSVMHRLQ